MPAENLPPNAFRPTSDQLRAMTFYTVRSGADTALIQASGSIAVDADRSTPVLLPYSGQVIKVPVEPGERVKAGQPLLIIASPELVDARSAVLVASAQHASASSTLRLTEQNAQRQKALYETAGGALKDYLQAQGDLANAQSSERAAQSTLSGAAARLALFGRTPNGPRESSQSRRGGNGLTEAVFGAPVSGVIADRNVAPGQFVSAGGSTPLMTIADLSHVWLVAQLPESEENNVHMGDALMVTTPALPNRSFDAKIDYIAPALDPITHRLAVRASIDNPSFALKPQMFANFAIRRPIAGVKGVLVPVQTLIHEGENARVWVLGKGGLLYARSVVAADTEGGMTRVTSGLQVGERVVASGALFVNEAGLDR
ncbi:MAG: efflux RND transporter periplasmic adaptor subunit [Sphingobium sp.]|nr:efflux RND transporter periplasmic adaptor subunit [Sphingobium sp.]